MFGTEDTVRAAVSVTLFVLMAIWEFNAPRRSQSLGRGQRWPGNLSLAIANVVLVRLIAPLTLLGAALAARANGWGLMNVLTLPAALVDVFTFVALDCVIYIQHVVFHRVRVLWRLHRVHHTDLEFDVTTGLRFHPGEAAISWAVKVAAVFALGAPPVVVVLFEIVLNASSMFNHGNVTLPTALDALLRKIVVTPDMHRVHHSKLESEMNSNFGFNFSWWDRLFATYRAQPADGHDAMELGLDEFRTPADLGLARVLVQPWMRP